MEQSSQFNLILFFVGPRFCGLFYLLFFHSITAYIIIIWQNLKPTIHSKIRLLFVPIWFQTASDIGKREKIVYFCGTFKDSLWYRERERTVEYFYERGIRTTDLPHCD